MDAFALRDAAAFDRGVVGRLSQGSSARGAEATAIADGAAERNVYALGLGLGSDRAKEENKSCRELKIKLSIEHV